MFVKQGLKDSRVTYTHLDATMPHYMEEHLEFPVKNSNNLICQFDCHIYIYVYNKWLVCSGFTPLSKVLGSNPMNEKNVIGREDFTKGS